MHHLRHLLLFISLLGLALAQDASKQLTNTHGENVDTTTERSAWLAALEQSEPKAANFTAEPRGSYVATATLTVTDPATPSEGMIYTVLVRAGTATIGGTAYAATLRPVVQRVYQSGAWSNRVSYPYDPAAVAITGGSFSGLSSGAITGDFTVDTSTFKVDSATDKVGIGTASPTGGLLHISGNTNNQLRLERTGTAPGYGYLYSNANEALGFIDQSGAYQFVVRQTTGNMGVGTFAPANKFGVKGAASVGNTYCNIEAPTNGLLIEGNVGIGITNPWSALHVNGTITVGPTGQGSWNGSTITGAQTLSGQVTLSNQTAASGTSAMTRDLVMDLLGSEDYFVFREEWNKASEWDIYTTGGGYLYAGHYDPSVQSKTVFTTTTTAGSSCGASYGMVASMNPVKLKPWKYIDISKTGGSVANCKIRVGFHDSNADLWAGVFTGFEYDPALSPNWRFYDPDNATYTDTGVVVTANTSYKFMMRSTTGQQIYWSINGGAETLRTGARDYLLNLASGIINTSTEAKQLVKDFTSFTGYLNR